MGRLLIAAIALCIASAALAAELLSPRILEDAYAGDILKVRCGGPDEAPGDCLPPGTMTKQDYIRAGRPVPKDTRTRAEIKKDEKRARKFFSAPPAERRRMTLPKFPIPVDE